MSHEEAAASLKEHFSFDKNAVENPDTMPSMFRSCQEVTPGICRNDPNFALVLKMVEQLQSHVSTSKISTPALFRMQAELVLPSASSSGAQPDPQRTDVNWYMLGTIRKRNICHIFVKYQSLMEVAGAVVPEVIDGCFTFLTSFEILVDAVEWAQSVGQLESLKVKFRLMDYVLVGHDNHPNYAQMIDGDLGTDVCFCLGPGEQKATIARTPAPKPPLRFGLTLKPTTKKRGVKRKQPGGDAVDLPDLDLNEPDEECNVAEAEPCQIGANESDDDLGLGHDEAFPTKLSLQQFKKLKATVKALANIEEHEDDPEDGQHHSESRKEGTQKNKKQKSDVEKENPEQGKDTRATSSSFFHKKLGLLSLKPVQRKLQCYICHQPVLKGPVVVVSPSLPCPSLEETFIHHERWTDKEPKQEVSTADWPSCDVLEGKEKTNDLKELVPPSSLRDSVKNKELVSGNEAWSAEYHQWPKQVEYESEWIEDLKETFFHHESWTDKEPEQEVWKADWPSWDVLQVKEKTKDLKELWAKHESEWIEDSKETFIHHESWTDKGPEQEVWKADWPSWDVPQVKEKTKDWKELAVPPSLPDNVKNKESSSEFHLVSGNEASSAEYDQRAKHQDEYELIDVELEDGYQNLKPLKKRTRRGQRGKRFLKHLDLDDKKFRRIKIDARELRYSQLSCKETFACGRSVWGLVNDLWTGRVRLSARFLQLTVFETRDKNSNGVVLKCINNRRLFALKRFAKRCGNRPVMVNANVFSEDSLSEAFQIMQLQSNNFQSPDPSCKRKCLG
eukprot:symbB.v1.2.025551.t2/scaffold2488.1/size77878/2